MTSATLVAANEIIKALNEVRDELIKINIREDAKLTPTP